MGISGDLLLMTNNNPSEVMKMLRKRLGEAKEKQDKKKREKKASLKEKKQKKNLYICEEAL